MAADISASVKNWSTTESSNSPSGSTAISTNLDDNLRAIQVAARLECSSTSIASASTTDLSTTDQKNVTVTGTTTITALGTVSAGMSKVLIFSGALTLTHNATSLILPTAANITTAAGDVCEVLSLGSGNWRCTGYLRANGRPLDLSIAASDGTVSAPSISFSADTDNGFYRIGANNWAAAAGGTKVLDFTATTVTAPLALTSTGTLTAANGFSAAAGAFVISSAGAITWSSTAGNCTLSSGPANMEIYGHSTGGGRLSMLSTGVSLYSGNNIPFYLIAQGTGSYSFSKSGTGDGLRWRASTGQLCVVETIGQPTITSGAGSGASLDGTDQAFKLTLGTGPGTTIRITFAQTWANPPIVIAQYQGSHIALRCAATTTLVDIIAASSTSVGDKIDVWCIGQEAS